MLQLDAADIVKHCQSEVTVESVTPDAVLFELLCISDGSYSVEFEESVIIDFIDDNICRQLCFRSF